MGICSTVSTRTAAAEAMRNSTTPRVVAQDARARACEAPPYRQFDFWIGAWEVRGPAGGVLGRNTITLEQGGCLLVENWVAGNGSQTGTSFNYFDARDQRWHQFYLSNSGNVGLFPPIAGTFTNGRMVLLSDDVNNVLTRWTWYQMEGGKVKQTAERSTDHGASWQTIWNADYIRLKDVKTP